jgi:dephospho-CoA kinase
MYRVALTGNIASGKTAVADVWERSGAAVIDADELSRLAVAPGTPGLQRVLAAFGPGVARPDGTLDRAALRRVVFADPARRRELETILHPEIARLRDAEDAKLAAAGVSVVVHVIPLLFEVGLDADFDAVVVVDTPESERQRRLVERRGLSAAEAWRMIRSQMPATDKRARASLVIENDATLEQLETRARDTWRELVRRAGLRT